MREFEVALKRRRRGEVVRMKISAGAPEALRAVIMEELHVIPDEVVEVEELRDGFLRVVTKMEGASMRYREIKQQLNLQIHESAATRASGGADA